MCKTQTVVFSEGLGPPELQTRCCDGWYDTSPPVEKSSTRRPDPRVSCPLQRSDSVCSVHDPKRAIWNAMWTFGRGAAGSNHGTVTFVRRGDGPPEDENWGMTSRRSLGRRCPTGTEHFSSRHDVPVLREFLWRGWPHSFARRRRPVFGGRGDLMNAFFSGVSLPRSSSGPGIVAVYFGAWKGNDGSRFAGVSRHEGTSSPRTALDSSGGTYSSWTLS